MNFSTGGGSTPYVAIAPGRYLARIVTVAYVGNIFNKFQQRDEPSVQFAFEVNSKGPTGKNQLIYRPLKASMHAQASLRKMVELLESRTLSNAEALTYDVTSLVGRSVWVEIENNPVVQADGTTRVYDKLKSVFPALESLTQVDHPLVRWDVRKDNIQALPQRLQKLVMTSSEWKAKHGNSTQPQYAFGQQVPNSAVNFTPPAPAAPASPPWETNPGAAFEF